jgi:hypothetical protein
LTLSITNFQAGGSAQAWQLNSSNSITRLTDIAMTGDTLTTTVAPQTITLFVIPAGTATASPPSLSAAPSATNSTIDLWIYGQQAKSYVLQSTTNFVDWTSLQTNTLEQFLAWDAAYPGDATDLLPGTTDALRRRDSERQGGGGDRAANPKAEGRRPTRCARATARREEGRNPKSEALSHFS